MVWCVHTWGTHQIGFLCLCRICLHWALRAQSTLKPCVKAPSFQNSEKDPLSFSKQFNLCFSLCQMPQETRSIMWASENAIRFFCFFFFFPRKRKTNALYPLTSLEWFCKRQDVQKALETLSTGTVSMRCWPFLAKSTWSFFFFFRSLFSKYLILLLFFFLSLRIYWLSPAGWGWCWWNCWRPSRQKCKHEILVFM